MTVQPKCPACGEVGKENIRNQGSEQKAPGGMSRFEIVYCGKCGVILSVLPNIMIQS